MAPRTLLIPATKQTPDDAERRRRRQRTHTRGVSRRAKSKGESGPDQYALSRWNRATDGARVDLGE